ATSAWVWKPSTLVGARAPCAKTLPPNGTAASAAPAPSTARRVGVLLTSDMVNPPAVVFLAAPRVRRAYIGLEFGKRRLMLYGRMSQAARIPACDIPPRPIFLDNIEYLCIYCMSAKSGGRNPRPLPPHLWKEGRGHGCQDG